jgi:hypothetical protein
VSNSPNYQYYHQKGGFTPKAIGLDMDDGVDGKKSLRGGTMSIDGTDARVQQLCIDCPFTESSRAAGDKDWPK